MGHYRIRRAGRRTDDDADHLVPLLRECVCTSLLGAPYFHVQQMGRGTRSSVRAYREEPALNGATRFYVGEALVINRL